MTRAADLGRLRWHSRRGLLELDLVLERFWRRHGETLSEEQAMSLEQVLALEENDLWEIICGRRDIGEPRLQGMIELLREI